MIMAPFFWTALTQVFLQNNIQSFLKINSKRKIKVHQFIFQNWLLSARRKILPNGQVLILSTN